MERKTFKRVTRTTPLTPEEAARDTELRTKIQAEFPPLETAAPGGGDISGALRTAIRESSRSVYQICKEAGVSQIVVSRFLSGERESALQQPTAWRELLVSSLPDNHETVMRVLCYGCSRKLHSGRMASALCSKSSGKAAIFVILRLLLVPGQVIFPASPLSLQRSRSANRIPRGIPC